ncbi:MAG: hypothetical protein R3A51_16165 [Nannocystaceae bacterium]|nr:hypothetical protein [Myxococcales bacterium]
MRHLGVFLALLALTSIGCGGGEVATSSTTAGPESETDDASTSGSSDASTIGTSTTDDGTGTSTTDASTTETTDEETTDTTGPVCDPEFMDGEKCSADCECFSGSCFVVPLVGGSCGECKVDADCPRGGCTVPNPWGMEGASCNMGEAGKGCETDEVCVDPLYNVCATIIEAKGILALKTCSECQTNDDCADPTPNCAAELDLENFTGILKCTANGALQNNEPCQLPGQLDPACASMMCSKADVMNVLDVGLCGECLSDGDCQPGQTCTEAWVDLGGGGVDDLYGSKCE